MLILGLSGGSGSGKTTVAAMLAKFSNAAVFDADKEVHSMYEQDMEIISLAREYFPDSIRNGCISREKLAKHFFAYDSKWCKFQATVHRKLLNRQKKMILNCRRAGVRYLILDIPLLMEEGFWQYCCSIVYVFSSLWMRRQRLSARGVSDNDINVLLSRQVIAEKRQNCADFYINTSGCRRDTVSDVLRVVRHMRDGCGRDMQRAGLGFTSFRGNRSVRQTSVYTAMR